MKAFFNYFSDLVRSAPGGQKSGTSENKIVDTGIEWWYNK
jgi:hypothetical protein